MAHTASKREGDLLARARVLAPGLAALRQDFHADPELRYEERRTADRIEGELKRLGIPSRRGAGGTAVLGVVEGARPGPRAALRADMDALPIEEETGLSYASRIKGRMHACGHDGHMACLAGAAALLVERRPDLAGSILLVFQPAEEGGAGARRLVEEGVLRDPPVGRIFALHAWPFLDAGVIGLKEGTMMASSDTFHVTVHGKGAHGAYPHLSVDPILIACRIVEAFQSVVARMVNPVEPAVLTVGRIVGGTTDNVIPSSVEMSGTLRALSEEVRRLLPERMESLARGIAEGAGGSIRFEYRPGYPVTVNDPEGVATSRRAAEGLGLAIEEIGIPSMGAEDFSFYLREVRGAMARLGNGKDGTSLHTPRFNFNDEALPAGAAFLAATALEALRETAP